MRITISPSFNLALRGGHHITMLPGRSDKLLMSQLTLKQRLTYDLSFTLLQKNALSVNPFLSYFCLNAAEIPVGGTAPMMIDHLTPKPRRMRPDSMCGLPSLWANDSYCRLWPRGAYAPVVQQVDSS